MVDLSVWKKQADIIGDILGKAPGFDKERRISTEEFLARQKKVIAALEEHGYDCGFVYSDEHYNGDVPYLGGNTNISVEPVAGIIGKKGFFLLAGLEGGYCAEQLAYRSGCKVRKVEMLKLADEDYPVEACSMEGVLEEACGRKPENIAFLSPAEVVPASMYCWFVDYFKDPERVVTDAQELYYKIKYIKSDEEMRMTEQAALICDVMLEGMASVLRPGLYETSIQKRGGGAGRRKRRDGGMAQWLRVCCSQVQSQRPQHTGQFTTTCNSSSNRSDTLSGLLGHTCTHAVHIASCRRAHTHP